MVMAEATESRDFLKPRESSTPKPIPYEEMCRLAKVDFRDKITDSTFTPETVESFIKEHVTGIRIGSVDVIIINQEHSEFNLSEGLPPVLKAYIASEKTKAVLEEYFNPELRLNAENMPILGVVVADIANKMSYMTDRFLAHATALLVALPLAQQNLALANIVSSIVYMGGVEAYGQITNKGMFDKEQVHNYEKILLSAEDARRVYVAEGIKQLAHEYQPRQGEVVSDETRPQIVVVYPEAHAKRIANYLENPLIVDRLSQTAKRIMYRTLPNLDFSVRTYEWKENLAKLASDPALANWQLVSNRPIKLFGN